MNKYKIIALFGEAGAGKDYIQKKIMNTIFGRYNLSEIISCTTRPPREGEIDGVHYHFIPTPAELIKKDLIEFTVFRDWWYGTPIDSLNKDKINIGVFNIEGIEQILKDNRIDCLPIKVSAMSKVRLIRQLNREKNPNCNEIIRRYLADQKDFENIPFDYFIVENNYDEIDPVLSDIMHIVRANKWAK